MQGGPFYPPVKTAGAGVHPGPYPPQGDQVGQGAHLRRQSGSRGLSDGEGEPDYYEGRVERPGGEQTLPPRVLNTRIRADNPW